MAGKKKLMSFEDVRRFLESFLGEELDAKRILPLAGATLGVIETASLAVGASGQGLVARQTG